MLALTLGFGLALRTQAQNAEPVPNAQGKRYAILSFNAGDFASGYPYAWWNGFWPRLNNSVGDMVTTEMVKAGFDVLERQRIGDVLKEHDFQKSEDVSPESAVKMGKLLGVQYLVVGTITEWGMSERGFSSTNIPILGVLSHGVGVKTVTGRCVIDFRVINVETGRIEAADSSEGLERRTNFTLVTDWYRGLSVQNDEWWSSQIGKATRKAARGIVAKMVGQKKDELIILDMASADEAVVEINPDAKLRKGDMLDIMAVTRVTRNAQGKVILKQTTPLGHAQVVEVQEEGAILHITDRVPGAPDIKAGCLVKHKH
jgi:curli biogenesis system outer membrane secretion channel CsgG